MIDHTSMIIFGHKLTTTSFVYSEVSMLTAKCCYTVVTLITQSISIMQNVPNHG